MKKIINFLKQNWDVLVIFSVIVVIIVAVNTCENSCKNEPLVLYKQNPELQDINKTLTFDVAKYQNKILILEEKIKDMETLNKQLTAKLSESTENLEYEIVKAVEETQDTSLIVLFDEMQKDQQNLIENYVKTIALKDSVILEKDNVIKSYVIATDKMSNEIGSLHAKNNEMLINEMMSKGKIKKRNRVIAVGSAIIVGGITTAILLNR